MTQDKSVQARRKKEAYRGTPTDDNADCADLDKSNAQVIFGQFLREDYSDIELWAKFINAERKEEFDMLAEKNQYIKSAYEHLQVISQDREMRLEYEAREKAIRDHNQMMLEAEERGREQGIEQGERRAEGRINKLNALLIRDKRFEDLERSTEDKDFQRELMLQYGI